MTFLHIRPRREAAVNTPMKILIAEDDNVSRALLRHIIESEPENEVLEAGDGAAAWERLQQEPLPDLCLLDIHMPELDGLELLRRIRGSESLRHLKVIFCSSVNERATVAQAAALSVNYYILKPYVKHLILEQVRKVARQLGPRVKPESPAKACERLGIDLTTYLALRKKLAEEITATVQTGRKSLKAGDLDSLAPKLCRLKGASLNLGLTGVFPLICRAETALEVLNSLAVERNLTAPAGNKGRHTGSPFDLQVQEVVRRLAELDENAQRLLKTAR